MSYSICHLSVVPCRSEPSDRSEMVSQLLFGETLEVLEKRKSWLRVRMAFDDYEVWIDEKQCMPISDHEFLELNHNQPDVATDLVQMLTQADSGIMLPVLAGSSLPANHNGNITIGDKLFHYAGEYSNHGQIPLRDAVLEASMVFQGAPYLWGGRSAFGIDCSGFVQVVYKIAGLKVKRDAWQQAEQGEVLNFVEEALPGDLAFFDNEDGRIIHVGIIIPGNQIIHASGRVRIDSLDHEGIYNADRKTYTHKLRMIRRLILLEN